MMSPAYHSSRRMSLDRTCNKSHYHAIHLARSAEIYQKHQNNANSYIQAMKQRPLFKRRVMLPIYHWNVSTIILQIGLQKRLKALIKFAQLIQ